MRRLVMITLALAVHLMIAPPIPDFKPYTPAATTDFELFPGSQDIPGCGEGVSVEPIAPTDERSNNVFIEI